MTRDASLNRKAVEADIQILPPVLERDFSGPFLAKCFGVELRHTIAPESDRYGPWHLTSSTRVRDIRFTDIFSDTNEVEYGVTQRLFIKRLHPEPCPGAGRLLPADLCRLLQWLSWFVGQKYFADPTFGGAVIPGRRNIFTTTLDFSGVSYITAPRSGFAIVSCCASMPAPMGLRLRHKGRPCSGERCLCGLSTRNFFSGMAIFVARCG